MILKKYSRYYKYIKPSLHKLLIGLAAGAIFGLSSGFGMPVIFDKVLRNIFAENGSEKFSTIYIVSVALMLPAIFAIRAIAGYASGYYMTYCSLDVLRRIKMDIFSKIQDYPMAFFDKYTSGDLLIRLSNDTSAVQSILMSFSSEIFRQPLQVLGAVGFLGYLSYVNGQAVFILIFLAAIPFCILPVQMIRKNMKRCAALSQGELSKIAQVFNENLDAIQEVRVFNMQNSERKKFSFLNFSFQNLCLKIAKYELMQQPFMEFLAASMVAVTFIYAYFAGIDFATFSAIGIALYFTIDPIKRIIRMSSDLIKTAPLFDRINEILDYKSTVPEPENPVKIERLNGEFEFKDVDFSYGGKNVLNDVNIKIDKGTSCALVGESGAGKSTFAKLAMRFYDVVNGNIYVDSIPIKNLSFTDLMKNFGSVAQYPVLFNDTIYNNILIAKPTASEEEVYAAAQNAFADDFIRDLENGYQTIVGERGDRLSGGQKQRIAIARVFLKNPPIIVLDEATSALDNQSEANVQKALDAVMKDRTVFVIAHRFSTIRNVKKIIVFKNGRIEDFGTHQELMLRCPYYNSLYSRAS